MKVALLVNRGNFDKYSRWSDSNLELIHMGNGEPDPVQIVATGAEALVVDAIMRVGSDIITKMPNLKLIHSQGVAYNGIDLEAAKNAGIYVCNCAGVNAQPVAEQSVLLMLSLLKGFRSREDMVYAGRQMEAKTACFENGLPELFGCKVGIVGLGAIGTALSVILKAFGCELFYHTRSGSRGDNGMKYLPLSELYGLCDIVSLHVPVTPDTTQMINRESLKQFKHGAILINTARGELTDNGAIVEALASGVLAGFGTDTLAPEPVTLENPFLQALPDELRSRVALSPHVAGITEGCFLRAYRLIRQNIEAIANRQKPECVVNS